MRMSDWSSDVCSSDLDTIKAMTDAVIEIRLSVPQPALLELLAQPSMAIVNKGMGWGPMRARKIGNAVLLSPVPDPLAENPEAAEAAANDPAASIELVGTSPEGAVARFKNGYADGRSEEHTSELQSLMRISYAVFCLKKKKK